MATGRITVRVDEQLQERLDAMAQSTGKSESQIVREAIAAYCTHSAERPNCYDLAKSLGIIGIIKDAPADLSTNRKYLKGMGRD